MKEVPVSFDYKYKTHHGFLSLINGGPGSVWFLMVNNFYWGKLFHVNGHGWQFFSNHDEGLNEFAEYFGHIVTCYEDSPGENNG